MERVDKFGRPIKEKTFEKMTGYGRVLVRNGYREAKSKPNLFLKEMGELVFFADMRGTREVPVWADPSPLLYTRFPQSWPTWKKRRAFREELDRLTIARVSFYEEFEPDGLLFGEGGDGYCVVCGKDFHDEGLYCSMRCAEARKDLAREKCRVCGKVIEINNVVQHHLSYKEDITINVCRSCHTKIHRGSKLPRLKPPDVQAVP